MRKPAIVVTVHVPSAQNALCCDGAAIAEAVQASLVGPLIPIEVRFVVNGENVHTVVWPLQND